MLDENSTLATKATIDAQLHHIFRGHVLAVILTGAVVFMLLVGFNNVPPALAVCLCAIAVCSLIAFPYKVILKNHHRWDYMAVSLGLSLAQLVFILPMIACIFAPAANFRTMLFG